MVKRTGKELQQYWQQHIEQWKNSDLSGPHYCEQHDLTYGQFNHWKSKLTANWDTTQSITASTSFVRVIQQEKHNITHSDLTLTLPNGIFLGGIQSDHIDTVVQLLERL